MIFDNKITGNETKLCYLLRECTSNEIKELGITTSPEKAFKWHEEKLDFSELRSRDVIVYPLLENNAKELQIGL